MEENGLDTEDGMCNSKIEIQTADELFDAFRLARDLLDTISVFKKLCRTVDINPSNYKTLYPSLKTRLTSWKCKSLWAKLDKRMENKEYKGKPCVKNKVLVIGSGPCGLRTAIEAAILGAQVVVIEKRDRFSRNNVLHLWPFLIDDLKGLAAKHFYGQFCAGAIDHISIARLQLILLKVCLLLGVQIYPKCTFVKLLDPTDGHGWKAQLEPSSHPVSKYEFDIIVGADGRRNALKGFKGKEFRGKLAIGITCNFVNGKTTEEARVEEISGVAFIFNQQFFTDLREETGIDLENIVYYKDETHYFVMTAKKHSLLKKGVIKEDRNDAYELLHHRNVNHQKLLNFAREAADFSTNHKLPKLDFAKNHYGKDDVAMFDFTSLYAAEHASKIYERKGYHLLAVIVGDSLLEPFWPTGSGCARGFLGSLDAAWMMKGWGEGKKPIDLLAEREGIFRLLAQTTPENLCKNYSNYSIKPDTRYSNINKQLFICEKVKHLYDSGTVEPDTNISVPEPMDIARDVSTQNTQVNAETLLNWCQQQTKHYNKVEITDMSKSWKDGLAFCAIIHRFRPDLLDFDALNPQEVEKNLQLAFDLAEEHLGVPPQMSASEMMAQGVPDKLMILSYVSQYYESLRNEVPAPRPGEKIKSRSPFSKLSAIARISRKAKKEKRRSVEKEEVIAKKSKRNDHKENNVPNVNARPTEKVNEADFRAENKTVQTLGNTSNRISMLAEQAFGVKDESKVTNEKSKVGKVSGAPAYKTEKSENCFFCLKRVYLMEKLSAEGHFFHRECFKCHTCECTLRLGTYAYIAPNTSNERGKFFCRPHFRKYYLDSTSSSNTVETENEPISKDHQDDDRKSKLSKRRVRARSLVEQPSEAKIAMRAIRDSKEQAAISPPKQQRKPPSKSPEKMEIEEPVQPTSPETESETAERKDSATRKKRLEARPLRRSSIASVRKSDAAVKAKTESFKDKDEEVSGTPTRRSAVRLKTRAKGPPGLPKGPTGLPKETPGLSNEPTGQSKGAPVEEIKKVSTEPKAAPAKQLNRLEWRQRMGTLERMRKRRAMYPPLSTVFNQDDEIPGLNAPTEGDTAKTPNDLSLPITPASNTVYKVVDIDLNGETKSKQVSPPSEASSTVSRTTVSMTDAKTTDQNARNSVVASRMARISRLLSTDAITPVKGSDWREAVQEKEKTPVEGNKTHESPVSQRRNLPTVPKDVEPFVSTPKSTKINSRKPTGKPRSGVKKSIFYLDKEAMKLAEEMDFVVLELDDVPKTKKETGETPESVSWTSGSSDEDLLENDKTKLGRHNARRFFKGKKHHQETTEEKEKRREQNKIRSEMKQREQKRLRMAQSIQRELEEVEVKQKALEQEGIKAEKALRGGSLNATKEEEMMLEFFQLVNKKNTLIRYESELVIRANSIQLEDQQGRLEQEIRELLMKDGPSKHDHKKIQEKTKELVDIVEQRNHLVELLDEERKREQEEDRLFEAMIAAKGFVTSV